ncbi:hypothetical protein JOD45_002281 [Scopulibacillus daqui]|uniref:DUF3891 family protein n=1 Tax=Scopulibacillus daqui TaxID=1469162 RepID=A0ABS2Q1N6_9BACL|nr:DUF3891 family protein [Scopulibacillus daqui]MBM7646056.1 hypothetical protein [Scopulibacillus daqui]
MIVRERDTEFVMIRQDDHARISGEFARSWREDYFSGKEKKKEVVTAVSEHDRGWIGPDSEPFIDDKTGKPFSFSNYPLNTKLIFYKHGIDETEAMNAYAGLLSSCHYMRFVEEENASEAKGFVHLEKQRQKRIVQQISPLNQNSFIFHYDLLRFCDSLSLYLCLNEPGASKKHEHPWFKNGIPVPETFKFARSETFDVRWIDRQTVSLTPYPFISHFTISLKYKCVQKEDMASQGLIETYKKAPWMELRILIKEPESKNETGFSFS